VTAETTERPDAPALRDLLPQGAAATAVAGASPILVAGALAAQGFTARGLVGAVLCPVLALLTAIDLRHRLLPNAIVLPAAALVVVLVAASEPHRLVAHLVAGAVYAGVLLVLALAFPTGMGMGDAKLALLIGVALGVDTELAVIVSSAAMFAFGLAALVRDGRAALRRTIPFGPFLALGAVAAVLLA
jgi:leader peptidase (prepilin peptidase) / N-methyltransferase